MYLTRYYRARPKNNNILYSAFKHRIITERPDIILKLLGVDNILDSKIYKWCFCNYGREWLYSYKSSKLIFYFKTKEDAMAFKLRWL